MLKIFELSIFTALYLNNSLTSGEYFHDSSSNVEMSDDSLSNVKVSDDSLSNVKMSDMYVGCSRSQPGCKFNLCIFLSALSLRQGLFEMFLFFNPIFPRIKTVTCDLGRFFLFQWCLPLAHK